MIRVDDKGGVRTVTLDRPERGNAMSLAMADALSAAVSDLDGVRIVVLRGAGKHFCAGGDVADMAEAAQKPGGIARMNRRFGTLLQKFAALPCATVAACQGAVMGGGFGLACVTDVTIAGPTAKFKLPETQLGISPAQIAPFIVDRLGRSQARRLAVTGESLDASQAVALGLAHLAVDDLDAGLETLLGRMRRCEPEAVRVTKQLVQRTGTQPLSELLDHAAEDFAVLAQRPEAQQGMAAFLAKEDPPWA